MIALFLKILLLSVVFLVSELLFFLLLSLWLVIFINNQKAFRKGFVIHEKMPSSWQSVSDMIEIARKSGCDIDSYRFKSLSRLLRIVESHQNLFEVRINRKLLKKFERENPELDLSSKYKEEKVKALWYYLSVKRQITDYDALQKIKSIIEVKKKIDGNTRRRKDTSSFNRIPVFS